MRKFFYTLVACCMVLSSALSAAGSVKVTINSDAATTAALALIGKTPAQLQAEAEASINDKFKIGDLGGFAKSMADSQINGAKGLGVDYASNTSYFITGVSAGIGANTGSDPITKVEYERIKNEFSNYQIPSLGINMTLSVMAGVNLGQFGRGGKKDTAREYMMYLNFFTYKYSVGGFRFDMTNFGLNGQTRIIRAQSLGLGSLYWDGVRITSGMNYLSTRYYFAGGVSYSSDQGGYTTTYKPVSGDVKLNTASFLVPIELSTAIRMFYFVSTYVGAGFDMALYSETQFAANAEQSISIEKAGVLQQTVIGKANLTIDEKKGASFLNPRAFAGVQFNIGPAKLLVHGTTSFDLKNVGLTLGVRAGW